MSFKILASVRHLELPDLDVIKTPNYIITNHDTKKRELIDATFKDMAGALHSDTYEKNMIAYSIIENAQDDQEFISKTSGLVPHLGQQIETHLLFLWFVKDNSVSLAHNYGIYCHIPKFNYWTGNNNFSTSDGRFITVDFTQKEIEEAGLIMLNFTEKMILNNNGEYLTERLIKNDSEIPEFRSSVDPFKDYNRFERALIFLKSARAVPHVPQKIAHYMAILECLFSNNNTLIIDNVSKRTAGYLEDAATRGIVKKAYNVRSRFVHGEKMKWTPEQMATISRQTDDIIRRVLKKIILEDYEKFLNADMSAYFGQLLSKFQSLAKIQ